MRVGGRAPHKRGAWNIHRSGSSRWSSGTSLLYSSVGAAWIQIIDSGCRGGRSLICCFVALLNIYSALSISVDCLCASWLHATLVCKRFWKNHVWRPSRPLPQAAGKFWDIFRCLLFAVCARLCRFFMTFRSGDGKIVGLRKFKPMQVKAALCTCSLLYLDQNPPSLLWPQKMLCFHLTTWKMLFNFFLNNIPTTIFY